MSALGDEANGATLVFVFLVARDERTLMEAQLDQPTIELNNARSMYSAIPGINRTARITPIVMPMTVQ
tara:strand:+ start:966 stop:1169 length:204 start_codon:yes stop_codon:yes gene_type:complete